MRGSLGICLSPSPHPRIWSFSLFIQLETKSDKMKGKKHPLWVSSPGLRENFVYSGLLKCLVQPYFKELLAASPGKAGQFKGLPIRKPLLIFSLTQQFFSFSNCSFFLLDSLGPTVQAALLMVLLSPAESPAPLWKYRPFPCPHEMSWTKYSLLWHM